LRSALIACVCFVALASLSYAQNTSGSIAGNIVDQQTRAIPGVSVGAIDEDQKFTFNAVTDATGRFVFPQCPPGLYTVVAEVAGFKKFEQKGIELSANDKLALGDITMQLGAVTETVEVTASAALLKTESAERSDTLEAKQVENIAVNGRTPLALVALVPGVVSTANFTQAGRGGMTSISTNGTPNNQSHLTLNGISNIDTGSNGSQLVTISIDAVQEFKMLTGVYQAEYGRNIGAQINIISKSGTAQFHGEGYWAYRNDWMNADNWMNNREGLPRNLLRQSDPGYNIGGPVYIPKVLKRTKDKLFFFWSQEFQHQTLPSSAKNVTVPTALERQGDFSQSVDNNGKLYTNIKDPLSGSPFPGSKIPASRQYQPGIALMNLLPLPNVKGVNGYNFTSQQSTSLPLREDLLRIDYNLSSKSRLFGYWMNNKSIQTSPYSGAFTITNNVPMGEIVSPSPAHGWGIGHTQIFSATVINEFRLGQNYNANDITIPGNTLTRAGTGVKFDVLYPSAITGDYLPGLTYGDSRIANAVNLYIQQAPLWNEDTATDASDTLSKIAGQHAFKVGVSFMQDHKNENRAVDENGQYSFGDNSQNPYSTSYGLANLAVGVFTQFNQTQQQWNSLMRFYNLSFFAQDTWKVNRRLTLDYGMRVEIYQPTYFAQDVTPSEFVPSLYNPAKAPRLYVPALNASGQRIASYPVTGQQLPASYIGNVVPGTANPLNGIVIAGQNGMSKYMRDFRPPQWGPRLGIAWDILGNQRLVLRTGGGIFYDRTEESVMTPQIVNPPMPQDTILNYGFATQLSGAVPLIGPQQLRTFQTGGDLPNTYSFSFGVQSKLPAGMVLDTSYVGSLTRHLQTEVAINSVPYGAAYLSQNQDHSLAANSTPGADALPAAFLRANYPNQGMIAENEEIGNTNYNSLQVSLNRRLAGSLFFGANYTWSKALGLTSRRIDDNSQKANYTYQSFDRRQNFSSNFVYTTPDVLRSAKILHAVASGWLVSGIAAFMTGAPVGVGFSIPGIGNANLTGSPDLGARIPTTGVKPATASDNPYARINVAAFAEPKVGSIGMESSSNHLFGPGINNWNLSLEKSFGMTERLRLRLRLDAFNAFNNTQFSGYNATVNFRSLTDPTVTNLPYDANGNLIWAQRNGFGTVNGARDPRVLQMYLRLQF
jgi:hypothetical protein